MGGLVWIGEADWRRVAGGRLSWTVEAEGALLDAARQAGVKVEEVVFFDFPLLFPLLAARDEEAPAAAVGLPGAGAEAAEEGPGAGAVEGAVEDAVEDAVEGTLEDAVEGAVEDEDEGGVVSKTSSGLLHSASC